MKFIKVHKVKATAIEVEPGKLTVICEKGDFFLLNENSISTLRPMEGVEKDGSKFEGTSIKLPDGDYVETWESIGEIMEMPRIFSK